jgi:hypothetical protein
MASLIHTAHREPVAIPTQTASCADALSELVCTTVLGQSIDREASTGIPVVLQSDRSPAMGMYAGLHVLPDLSRILCI